MVVELTGAEVTPAEVIKTWKAEFQRFWPERNWFYGPLAGIAPGEVALLNLGLPGRMKLSTGVLVLYADDESFTLMTPEATCWPAGSPSAEARDGVTVVQIQALERTNDPLYELAMCSAATASTAASGSRRPRTWPAISGVEPEVDSQVVCVDRRRQWGKAGTSVRTPPSAPSCGPWCPGPLAAPALHPAVHLATQPPAATRLAWGCGSWPRP